MSLDTVFGRYMQIAVNQRKDHTVAEIRCFKRGCILASTLKFEWQGKTHRVMVVFAHTGEKIVKEINAEGVLATARRERFPGLTAEIIQDMTPGELLDRLQAGELKESHLEYVYRESGGNLARVAYLATVDDFRNYSPNTFARCNHMSGNLEMKHWNNTRRRLRIDLLTGEDNAG